MHGHVGGNPAPPWVGGMPDLDANLRAYLYCGVTTILDPADIASQIFPRRERVARGELLGPTIYAAGPMFTAPGGHPVPVLRPLAPWWLRRYLIPRLAGQVDTPAAARGAADALGGQGPRPPTPLEREIAPADVLAAFDHVPASYDFGLFGPYLEKMRAQRQAWRDNVRRLHEAGVTILAGSDMQTGVFPGAGLHRELHLLAESGLTPAQAIRAATLDAARFLANGKEPDFGVGGEGKRP